MLLQPSSRRARDGPLRALGCAADAGDPEPVAAAIAGLGAREAEDMVTGAGGIAAAVRDEASWRAEPPGQAVAATPQRVFELADC